MTENVFKRRDKKKERKNMAEEGALSFELICEISDEMIVFKDKQKNRKKQNKKHF